MRVRFIHRRLTLVSPAGGETVSVSHCDCRDLEYNLQKKTWSSTETFLLAMLLHPDVQKKAQAQIDDVVGTDRLPDFGDRESLPYIDCIVQETLRYVSSPLTLVYTHLLIVACADGIKLHLSVGHPHQTSDFG